MRNDFLNLNAVRYLCPFCGQWHRNRSSNSLDYYDSSNYKCRVICRESPSEDFFEFYFTGDNEFVLHVGKLCNSADTGMTQYMTLDSLVESDEEPIVTLEIPFTSDKPLNHSNCSFCDFEPSCNLARLGEAGDNNHMTLKFGFEFEREEYEELHKLKTKMEEKKMKTSIKQRLYENSPKENVEALKKWAEQYKPVLKWAVPVVSIYTAYRILNSKNSNISVNNVDEICTKHLGFNLDPLKDKKALKQLMAIGGISATAYAAVSAVSSIYSDKDDSKDIFVEDVEDSMNQLEKASQKFAWIQPKTEALLPIAISVLIVYTMTNKPELGGKIGGKVHDIVDDLGIRVGTCLELAGMFIQDKFKIDLSDEEEQQKVKKFALLAGIVGISAILYGKKVLGNRAVDSDSQESEEENSAIKTFIAQLIPILKKLEPTVYTTIISALVAKKVLKSDEIECDDTLDADDFDDNSGTSELGAGDSEDLSDSAPAVSTSDDPDSISNNTEPNSDDSEDLDDNSGDSESDASTLMV